MLGWALLVTLFASTSTLFHSPVSVISPVHLSAEASVLTSQTPLSSRYAHYIVFERYANGTIEPVFYRRVLLAAPLETASPEQVTRYLQQADREYEHIAVALQFAGRSVFQTVADVPRWLRGEFQAPERDQTIDGHIVPLSDSAFVVRVPVIEGATLILQDDKRATLAQYDLRDLAAATPQYSSVSEQARASMLQNSGPPTNRLDLLIMGDGYTAGQQAQFAADANQVASRFFDLSPYAEYRNYANIHLLFTASRQSGADHPSYVPNCNSPECCSDQAMQNDPLQGTLVDTAFDCSYCVAGIHRLLAGDTSKVFAAASAVPDWDHILLIVNDTTYGGSGGAIATFSLHSAAVQLAQHEYSHSFTRLADEYSDPYPGYPTCSDLRGNPCEPNVTDATTRSQIKWRAWISPTTPVPTTPADDPRWSKVVGLFEGARYQARGIFRPRQACLMRSLDQPWCEICKQSYVLRLYQGGWGVPSAGIQLIEPGSAQPQTDEIALAHPSTQIFQASILQPIGGPPVRVSWFVDDEPVCVGTSTVFTYTTRADQLGRVTIRMLAEDTTTLVKPDMAGSWLQSTHTWSVSLVAPASITLSAEPPQIVADGSSISAITAVVTDDRLTDLAGLSVTFQTTLGALEPLVTTTDAQGVARTTLTAGTTPGVAIVTAATELASSQISVELEPWVHPIYLPIMLHTIAQAESRKP